jgi:hypothetical protein
VDDSYFSSIDFNSGDCMIDELILINANLVIIPLAVLNPDNIMVTTILIPLFIFDIVYFITYILGISLSKFIRGDNA